MTKKEENQFILQVWNNCTQPDVKKHANSVRYPQPEIYFGYIRRVYHYRINWSNDERSYQLNSNKTSKIVFVLEVRPKLYSVVIK